MKKKRIKTVFTGFKQWNRNRKWLGFSTFYVLPSIVIDDDSNLENDAYPLQIIFAWLFWSLHIYVNKEDKECY